VVDSIAAKTHTSILLSANFAVLKFFSNIYQIRRESILGDPRRVRDFTARWKVWLTSESIYGIPLEIWRSSAQKAFSASAPCLV
jgi:hypothetical protein